MRHFLLAIVLMACSLLTAETWIYEKTVVKLPMGEEDGQLSVRYMDNMHEGPTSFTIDEDENIYVKTRRKNIIKKFDKNGNFICASKYEKGAGDVVRFIGYHDGYIYTMSGDLRVVCLRRYTRDLDLHDFHLIQAQPNTFYGRSFIESNSGDFGLLRGSNPKAISASKLVLQNNVYHFHKMELFDSSYKPVELQSVWSSEIGHRFMDYDTSGNLYFERYIPHEANDMGIIDSKGYFISTNVIFESNKEHHIAFMDSIYPIVLKNGIVYNLLVTEERIELIRWYKTGEEK